MPLGVDEAFCLLRDGLGLGLGLGSGLGLGLGSGLGLGLGLGLVLFLGYWLFVQERLPSLFGIPHDTLLNFLSQVNQW